MIVAGQGPSGAVAAYECARRGLCVLALDKEILPRYKPCGGALSRRIDSLLGESFHELIENRVRGLAVTFRGEDSFRVSAPDTVAYLVRRERFDHFLSRRAAQSGAEMALGERVVGFDLLRDRVRVRTTGDLYEGRFLIGADGACGIVAKQLGLWPPYDPWVAMEGEFDCPEEPPRPVSNEIRIDFGTAPWGYGWAFPKNRRLSLGVAGSSGKIKRVQRLYETIVTHLLLPAEKKGLEETTRGWLLPLWHSSRRQIACGRVLLVGDAASLVDPFLGEGIFWGVRSGQIAAASLAEALKEGAARTPSYVAGIRREIYPEMRAAQRIASVLYSFPELAYDKIKSRPWVVQEYFEILQGRRTYPQWWASLRSSVFGGLLRTLRLPGISKDPGDLEAGRSGFGTPETQ